MIYIGIDPGSSTGVAIWENGKYSLIKTLEFWEAVTLLMDYLDKEITAVIENPNLNPPVFNRGQDYRQAMKIAQNVGMNKRDAQLWIDFFKRAEIPVIEVKPESSKWTKETFYNFTGYEGQTSQHGRDAGKLVFGMK